MAGETDGVDRFSRLSIHPFAEVIEVFRIHPGIFIELAFRPFDGGENPLDGWLCGLPSTPYDLST